MVSDAISYLIVCGKSNSVLSGALSSRVAERINNGQFRAEDVAYVSKVDLRPINGSLKVSPVVLEKLRRLCQLWDVDMKPGPITSHRPIIGPIIVLAKRLIYPIVRFFLKGTLEQQRDFNAATIALLAELGHEREAMPKAINDRNL